jgi:hypothetical protein
MTSKKMSRFSLRCPFPDGSCRSTSFEIIALSSFHEGIATSTSSGSVGAEARTAAAVSSL